MIMVMGWLDPVGSPIEAIHYYEQVEALGRGETVAERRADTQHFLRLYMVPGMGHSAEGPGAAHFSSSTRDSVPPVSDAKHDVKAALHAWVEKRSEEHTSELQSLMRISYAVFFLKNNRLSIKYI